MISKKKDVDYLCTKYGTYFIKDESPIQEFSVGLYSAVATNKRLIFLRKLPRAFVPVPYGNIVNIEHSVYVSWDLPVKFIALAAASAYGYMSRASAVGLIEAVYSFFHKNIPELDGIVSALPSGTLLDVLLVAMPILAAFYLVKFLMSMMGRLKIAVKGASAVRIDTGLTGDVRELIKMVEASMEGGGVAVSQTSIEDESVDPGRAYLIKEYRPENSMRLFLKAVNEGSKGLLISRANPDQVRAEYGGDADFQMLSGLVSIYWLTDSLTDKRAVSPEPDQLFALIGDFIEKNPRSVILLDGLEYLISHSNFEQILRFMQGINDKVGLHDSRMIAPISPQALSEKEMALLEREMSKVL